MSEVAFSVEGFSAYVSKPEPQPGHRVVGQPGIAMGEHEGEAVLILRHEDGSMMSVQLDEARIDVLSHLLAAHIERGNDELRGRTLQ